MYKQYSRIVLHTLWLVIVFTCVYSMQSLAAAKTDAEIRNYTSHELTIEFKKVDLKGQVTWVPIANISSRSSRVVRNLTIGSVLRAKRGNAVVDKHQVKSPAKNSTYTVINIRE